MTYSIKETIMERDGICEYEADELIEDAKDELRERTANGDSCIDICEEFFGLEPDYLLELLAEM